MGVVLAAGLSSRMGRLKQLLPLAGRPAIQFVVEAFVAHLAEVVVVVGYRGDEVRAALEDTPVRCVSNPNFRGGMLSSVQCGVKAAGAGADFLIGLGDQPVFSPLVIPQLLARMDQSGNGIILPVWQGRRGHPILLANRYRQEILALPAGQGLNAVTRGHPDDTCEVEVEDIGVLEDMDTPQDYQRIRDRMGREADGWKS